jgi:hypothetical protein
MNSITTRPAATANGTSVPDFRRAVAAAVKVYAKTGRMLDAALAYAEHGVPVFPVNARSKNPIAARLRDDNSVPIPGTGGFKRATCDPVQIRKWWKRREHLIGVPMGPRSGVWCVDIDTKAGGHHDDGMAVWNALQAEHGPVKTRQHVTASGGLHEIFVWRDDHPITSRRGDVPHGIDVKGDGGYIIAPPGRRKGRHYTVTEDIAPKKAPQWLYDMIGRAPPSTVVVINDPAKPRNEYQNIAVAAHNSRRPLADINELAEAMAFVQNPELDWDAWTAIGLALHSATGGGVDGFRLFDDFSKKSSKYSERATARRWLEITHSPPNRTGASKLYKLAIANGWNTKPTHSPSPFTDIGEARQKIASAIDNFLNPNDFQHLARSLISTACAIKSETGVGKTEQAIKSIAGFVQQKDSVVSHRVSKNGNAYTVTRWKKRRVGYGVATHRLGGEIESRFRDRGVEAATYRGRNAIDPQGDGEQLMCLAPGKVKVAMEARQDIEQTCCRKGDTVCEFFDRCGYQRQKAAIKDANAIVFASDVIFHSQPVIGRLNALFLDEEFSSKQVGNEIEIPLKELSRDGDRELVQLAATLAAQPDDGPLLLTHAAYASDLNALRVRLLTELPKPELSPAMSATAMLGYIRRNKASIRRAVLYRNLADVLPDIEAMWTRDIQVSGRLFLDTGIESDSKARVLRWQGVRKITRQFDVPAFIMDATLPSLDILRLTHPYVRQVADIRVAMPPCVRIAQVIGAPTSKTKLIAGPHKEKHQQTIVRHIIRRWLECGRGKALVISQEEFKLKVLRHALPPDIALLHFNALSGVDAFKDVRLAIVIGRTLPKSEDIESSAGILKGAMPECAAVNDDSDDEDDNDSLRYQRVKRGIRLRDGTGRAVRVNQHPDELCEALRWQACEGQLIQAVGRARGINRTDETPLDIDMLFDEVLPIEVDAVENWERPSLFFDTARDGVMLSSPTDMKTVWPNIFENLRAAERTAADDFPALPGFECVRYQPQGRNQKWRIAWFDKSAIGDPAAWLAARLGPVSVRPAP